MRMRSSVDRLEEHPNLGEILGVLAQLPHIADRHLPQLAQAWSNTNYVADARRKALSPESPLVLEVLAAFDAVSALFADDLDGGADYVTVDPRVTVLALKAVRDAIAAVYARPVLGRGEYACLLRPWRQVFPMPLRTEPDLGPEAERVTSVLSVLSRLSTRCHDSASEELFEALVDETWLADHERHDDARLQAWHAAVMTSRRRMWTLIRRSGAEGLARACSECGGSRADRDETRVLALCLDAACALLVADALPDHYVDVLIRPLERLIPAQRTASES
ncbi:MAG: hypothetical protein M3Z02_07745 [Actinomycetota bacterium]|nr:hypothetical protein [Actinomycetota bacterium]